MKDCKNYTEVANKVMVSVDVTKIVKYSCAASVLIVGIIFGSSVLKKFAENQEKDY